MLMAIVYFMKHLAIDVQNYSDNTSVPTSIARKAAHVFTCIRLAKKLYGQVTALNQ
jgi:hypothetical protein